MLPQNTFLGQLTITEVYEYLDGPRLFTAMNNIGTKFLVFWCDEVEDATGWLYLPISETKLNSLRRKELTLNAAFRQPEADLYLVYTSIHSGQDSAELVTHNEVDPDLFPPEGYYIEYASVVDETAEGWNFQTILNGRKPSAEGVSEFIGRFRELAESIITILADRKILLYPNSALAGSIRIKFSTENDTHALESLRIIHVLLQSSSEEEFRQQLLEHQVNPSQLRDFLNSISRNELDVEIVPKLASDGEAFSLTAENTQQYIKYLDNINYIAIDSIKIPQADNIDRVLLVLRLMSEGSPLTHENIEGINSQRQVDYYTSAAYAYGLATKDKQLTAAGHFVNSHQDREKQYQILADRFESTDFGWAWMKWAQVQYMTDLEPESAADFLMASVPNLSENTARRRARTLINWLTILQPYHRKYVSE